jgi:adenosylcobinamide-phosphate synthase
MTWPASPASIALLAVLLDGWLGEPRRLHPLVGFGRLAQRIEARLYGPPATRPALRRLRGALGVGLLLAGPAALAWLGTKGPDALAAAWETLLLYLALGASSLGEHAAAVRRALDDGDLEGARKRVGRMVSRDTRDLDPGAVAKAAVESVLENGCDAVFGALFWFAVAGAPGAVLYRLANTVDAMWGYKNRRYRDFGWAAARLDDALNWIPARLTALTYGVLGGRRSAWRCWRSQAAAWESPNAGPVMAAGAGALGLRLGGPARYRGRLEQRPILGEGREATPADIDRAIGLVRRGMWLWVGIALAWEWALG